RAPAPQLNPYSRRTGCAAKQAGLGGVELVRLEVVVRGAELYCHIYLEDCPKLRVMADDVLDGHPSYLFLGSAEDGGKAFLRSESSARKLRSGLVRPVDPGGLPLPCE